MADLVITAANVARAGDGIDDHGTAGVAVTAGQAVYLDSATGTYKLADNDSATAEARSPDGLALNPAAIGQPLAVRKKGRITIGAAVTAGVPYYLSSTAGGICPAADLGSGDYPALLGFAVSATVIDLKIVEAGVALA